MHKPYNLRDYKFSRTLSLPGDAVAIHGYRRPLIQRVLGRLPLILIVVAVIVVAASV